MNETFIPPELRETLVGPEEQLPSGWDIYRVGDDLYSVTLPDGRKVVSGSLRQHHRLSKPQAEQKPQAGGWHPIPPLSSIPPPEISRHPP